MTTLPRRFNPPPGWPRPPEGWVPPRGWAPDPSWPAPPVGWQLWLTDSMAAGIVQGDESQRPSAEGSTPITGTTVQLNDDVVLQEAGIYRYHHPLESAVAYKERISDLSNKIVELLKNGAAITASETFTYDGSLAKGRALCRDLSKLMLRAYNAESENILRSMRPGNVVTALGRLEASRLSIAKLGALMQLAISPTYHELRVQEVELTADFLVKKEREREEAREEREKLREQRRVEQELAAARERLDKERAHLVGVISKLAAGGGVDADLESKLAEIDAAIAHNDFRAANIRAGYVYVISNRGAFGKGVVKIGMTRRLEPLERVHELGDASVPFRFDVHALYFSEDAVALEAELHSHFASRRLNWANLRKEFFFASPSEVQEVLADKVGNLLEFEEQAASLEYLQSTGYWPADVSIARPVGLPID